MSREINISVEGVAMKLQTMIDTIKNRPDYHQAGMILAHNGVVRETSRDGRGVSGLIVQVDHNRLSDILDENRRAPGIIDIQVWINEDRNLAVGDDVMFLVVAGDIREHVIATLERTLNEIKSTVTSKTEFFD
jgi:molybdopterin synthase catalytic subunit